MFREILMKKLIVIIGASCLLVGCGSQNLGPLEDKISLNQNLFISKIIMLLF
jgi:uncharacterized protein YcfL